MNELEKIRDKIGGSKPLYINTLLIGGAVFLFLLAIQSIGSAFGLIGKDYARYIVDATSNPSIGLFIGLLSTAILQSSSTTTSLAVAAVAAGSISLENAIPIVMGANVGTTLTSTLVSMSYVTKPNEFKKAIAAGTVHDIFNLLTVIVVFPLEINYGFLSKICREMASWININEGNTPISDTFFIYRTINLAADGIIRLIGPYLTLLLAATLLLATVKFISNILYKKLVGDTRNQFHSVIFNSSIKSFGWGFLLTSAIQSSSLSTSLIVPLAATGQIKLKRAFQFIIGANLGTTITALLAAMFKSEAAISLAFAHLMFNIIGVALFMPIPFLTRIPLFLADKLGSISIRYKLASIAYILIIFFIIPFTLIYHSRNDKPTPPAKDEIHQEANY